MTDGKYEPDARAIPEAVLWSEGMMLSPQHFQIASRRNEMLIAYAVGASLPYSWGLVDLGIQTSSLAQGVFEVERLEGVMPDGLVVCHPLEDSLPLSLDLKPHFDDLRRGPCTIHLAVLSRRPGLRVDPETNVGRYRQKLQKAVTDDFAADGIIDVASLRPALTVIVVPKDAEPPLKFSTLPLAVVSLDESKVVAEEFAPPTLLLDRRSVLYAPVAMAVERLRAKAATRANYLKSTGAGSFSLEAMQLRALVAPLPMLETMIAQGASHPFDVYLALANAIGSLACLTGLNVPTPLPPYNHADPLPAFQFAIGEIDALIDQLEERFDKIPFENLGGGKYRLELKAAWLQEFLYVQLFAAPSQPLWQVEQWARHALIGDKDRMPQIREARALGAPRALIERADKIDLVRSSDAVLLRIPMRTPGQPAGLQLGEQRILEIESEIPSDASGRPLRIVLYVLKSEQGAKPAGPAKPPGRP